jgi:hypothetical protein
MLPSLFALLRQAVSGCATDVDDSCLAVDVALLERHPLAGPQTGLGREQYRRPVARPEPRGRVRRVVPMTRTVASRCADAAGCRLPAWRGWSRSFPKTTARASTCRSAWVASKRWPGEIVIRQAAISGERSSGRRRPPRTRSVLASSQQSCSIVSASASYWARYSSTSSSSLSALPTPFCRRRMFERPFECLRPVTLGGETSPPQPSPTRTAGPLPVPPHRAAVHRAPLELEDLNLLHRRSLPPHVASM